MTNNTWDSLWDKYVSKFPNWKLFTAHHYSEWLDENYQAPKPKVEYIITSDVPSMEVLYDMEIVHPEPIQWDIYHKISQVKRSDVKGYWLKVGNEYAAELIVEQNYFTRTIQGLSISTLPGHTGKGYAGILTQHMLAEAKEKHFEWYEGTARQGASWRVVEKLGAEKVGISYDHGDTGEDYIRFTLKIQ